MFSNKLFPSELYSIHLYPRKTGTSNPNLSNNINFTQLLTNNINYNKSLSSTLTFTQTVSASSGNQKSLSSTLTFTQTVSSLHSYKRSLSSNISFTQIVSSSHSYKRSLSSTLTFTQTTSYQHFGGKNQSINQNLSFTQTTSIRKIYHKSLSSTLNFTQIDSGKDIKSKSITQTLSFNQNNSSAKIKIRRITQTLSLAHHFNYNKYINFHIKHTLFFKDFLTRTTKFNQFLVDILLFKGGGGYSSASPNASKIVDGTNIIYQDTIPVIVHKYIQLTGSTTIILPAPLFGDSRTNIASLNIQRMVKGNIKTLIKTTNRQKINYKFQLKRQKAYELQKFIDNNDLTLLNLENWKGELWQVKVINNPVIFEVIEGRYVCPDNRETHEIEIQFEGILLSGSASSC